MNKIKVLSEEVSNRIAAGEVIERPASIVKELVENSLDSLADKIVVNIENGGKKLIQVIDNGAGMNEQDALLAFERHATSKIKTVDDIFHISSLGFRGEALPSISSICHLELITRTMDEELATKITLEAGIIRDVKKCSANPGTSITVRKLFDNIPARKKFLKSDQVEFKHILNYLHYQTVVFPQINFKFLSNGKERLNYQSVKSIEQRLAAIFGSDFLGNDMIELKSETDKIKIKGFISGLEQRVSSIHDHRYIFVNNRFIKDKIVYHAINSAYEPFIKKSRMFLEKDKTPPYIIFIEIDPELVDFNVHPAKLEIRFRDSQLVHNFIFSHISNKLEQYEAKMFQSAKEKFSDITRGSSLTNLERKILSKESFIQSKPPKNRSSGFDKSEFSNLYQSDLFKTEPPQEQSKKTDEKVEIIEHLIKSDEEIVNPWQIHESYILAQIEDGLLIIDQHAAHERILYEKMLHRIHGTPAVSQKLIFPLVIDVPPYYKSILGELLDEHQNDIINIGFSIKSFSGNSIVIDEIPAEMENWQGGEQFVEILKQLEEEKTVNNDFHDCLAKSVSCKAAVKFGKSLTKKEMVNLINDLFACEVPYFCPHGRPLMIKLTLNELEKRFKRIL